MNIFRPFGFCRGGVEISMKDKIKTFIVFSIIIIFAVVTEILNYMDSASRQYPDYSPQTGTIIHLYGEYHGEKDFYEKEVEIWKEYYERGNRDLFVELPYYTAEFLNLWMKADNDEILNRIYNDIEGTASHTKHYLNFFKSIKKNYPETIFHGTDVGHQYAVTGARYLQYLEENGLKDSEEYERASVCIEQGKHYGGMEATDHYREAMMVKNFCDTFERIGEKEVMGIYGSYHINPNNEDLMAGQIKAKYGDIVEGIYISNMVNPTATKHFSFGIGYVGIIFLLMLFIPNIIWTKFQPTGYSEYAKNENKVLGILEKTGEVGATVLMLIFTDFNFNCRITGYGFFFSFLDIYRILAFVLMVLYEIYWIRYFVSKRTMKDFYRGICGIPLAGATIPVLALLLFSTAARNIALLIVAIILGIGHIGIHYMHYKEIQDNSLK